MKVVLFCGGLGMRLRENNGDPIPKPMVTIGYRPLLWHVMKYYAHFGHRDFILCLGYKADVIKQYFLNYNECLSNDFVLAAGGKHLQLLSTDIDDWRITFADTGANSNIGERLKAVEPHLIGEEVFLANYSDSLTDLYLPHQIGHFHKHNKIASFVSVKPNLSYHFVTLRSSTLVKDIRDVSQSDIRINGGYFIFKKDIFKYLKQGEELVIEPFQRLIRKSQLIAFSYDGFWKSMDTFKDKQLLEDLYTKGRAPWEVWRSRSATQGGDRLLKG